jgi:cation diffusion facilitator family transporter
LIPAEEASPGEGDSEDNRVSFTIKVSFVCNIVLFFAKVYAFVVTWSLAILAALVDSTVDLLAQGVVLFAEQAAASKGKEYPAGRRRLEPVGVLVCAVIMGLASVEVIRSSVVTLGEYLGTDNTPGVRLTLETASLLLAIIVLKVGLYVYGARILAVYPSVSLEAVVQDNYNDVLSNGAALLSALVAVEQPAWWWCDPVGAIVISVYIIRAWLLTALEQVEMVVGKEADPEFVERVQEISRNHSELMKLDTVRAYHFGPKFLVELEMVMDQNTPLHITHDTGIRLQHKIENIDEVERCFVHIDYSFREFDDHDPDVPLTYKVGDSPRLKLITPDGDAPMFANPAAGTAEAFKSIR